MSNRVNKYLYDMKIAMESINEFVAEMSLETASKQLPQIE